MKRAYEREIARSLPDGYAVDREVPGHARVRRPDGEHLRDGRGMPVTLTGTPGDWRSIKNDLARIRRGLRAESVRRGP